MWSTSVNGLRGMYAPEDLKPASIALAIAAAGALRSWLLPVSPPESKP